MTQEQQEIILNDEQQEVFRKVIKFLERPKSSNTKKNCIMLYGPAGTGKTSTVREICKNLGPEKVCLTCPTNKAVDVLKKGMKEFHPMTIHKFLCMEFVYDSEGNSRMAMTIEPENIKSFLLLVVDECSMVDKDILKNIRKWSSAHKAKVLFLGDIYQLPPVNFSVSPVFEFVSEKMRLTLTRNMRAGEKNVAFAHSLFRAAVDSLDVKLPESWRVQSENISEEVLVVPDKEFFISEFLEKQTIEEDTSVVLCWRNKVVDEYNKKIRMKLFGEISRDCPYMKGETMMFHQYFFSPGENEGDEGIRYATCDKVKVEKVEEGKFVHPWFEEEIPAYKLYVKNNKLYILNPKFRKKYDAKTKEMREYTLARTNSFGVECKKAKSKEWKKFYRMRDSFLTPLSYSYSMTTHKSQASTFDHVFVDLGDILANWNKQDAHRCAYTAVSRSRKSLFLLE